MKRVVNASTVAHLWANKTQEDARTPTNNMYFNGDTIYSYGSHFPIAVHYKGKVLFTNRTYSSTTSKHVSDVRSASSHLDKIYCDYPKDAREGFHKGNFEAWEFELNEQIEKLNKAKKPEIYLNKIESIKSQINEYCEFLGTEPRTELSDILEYLEGVDVSNIKEKAKLRQAEAAEKELKRAESAKPLLESYSKAWREGNETDYRMSLTDPQKDLIQRYMPNDTFLRVRNGNLETSKGIKIPLPMAAKYYKQWTEGKIKRGSKIAGYTVDVCNEFHLIAGCHTIPVSEIEYIGSILNVNYESKLHQ